MEIRKSLKSVGYITTASLATLMALTAFTFKSSAETDGDYTYALVNGEAKITKYEGSETELVIPSELGGYKVTNIGASAFKNLNIKSVVIPEGVTEIGNEAFYSCNYLASVTIPSGVTTIGNYAFYDCDGFATVTIPDTVTTLGKSVFAYCGGLTTITIPDNVTSLGDSAFYCCEKLTSAVLPKNITSIGDSTFYSCGKLEGIIIPESVTSIGESAFRSCNAFTEVVIPNNVKTLERDAFYYCINLKKATLSNSLTSIGRGVFSDCVNLESITLPSTLTELGEYAFNNCPKITSVTIPEGVTSIGRYAFYKCTSLTTVSIPASVKTIGGYVFYCCENLASVTIANGVESIGEELFLNCTSLTNITIPNTIKNLSQKTFCGCTSLTSVTIPEGIEKIGISAFNGCVNLTSITLPSTTTKIDNYAFSGCSGLKTVTFTKNVKNIHYMSFEGCESLTDVYYTGTQEDWNNIQFFGEFDELLNANIHYSYLVSNFVDRLYAIILGRDAEAEGLADWTNRLTSGTASSAEIVYGIANSQEFANRGLSNEDIVETMYQAMLGRASDEGGKANWINCLNSGMTVTGIINGFSGSQEFANICAEYGIQAGAITTCEARDRNNGLTLFVSRMYTKALNRPYDVAGLNDWTNRYLTGTAEVSDIAFGFIFSPEFVGKGLSDSDYVDTLYRTFFNREPDEGGKADWMNKLANGMAREDVLNGFVGSQECINLVATFGI